MSKINEEKQEEDLETQLSCNQMYDGCLQCFETMKSKYLYVRDGYLRQISVTKRRIFKLEKTDQTYSFPYSAEPRRRQLRKDEVDETLEDNVAEATTTKSALSFVLAPKSVAFCGFASTIKELLR